MITSISEGRQSVIESLLLLYCTSSPPLKERELITPPECQSFRHIHARDLVVLGHAVDPCNIVGRCEWQYLPVQPSCCIDLVAGGVHEKPQSLIIGVTSLGYWGVTSTHPSAHPPVTLSSLQSFRVHTSRGHTLQVFTHQIQEAPEFPWPTRAAECVHKKAPAVEGAVIEPDEGPDRASVRNQAWIQTSFSSTAGFRIYQFSLLAHHHWLLILASCQTYLYA